jgi:hypothetical protein
MVVAGGDDEKTIDPPCDQVSNKRPLSFGVAVKVTRKYANAVLCGNIFHGSKDARGKFVRDVLDQQPNR